MMNRSDLITKYKHTLTLKNYSANTINAYLNGLASFLKYVQDQELKEVTENDLNSYFYFCKNELGYSYSMMKQLLASVKFLYQEVLKKYLLRA
ncbi:MAG: phage integrase N-terminal SAM-like domain-containing protein [Balneolaceae bacterium]